MEILPHFFINHPYGVITPKNRIPNATGLTNAEMSNPSFVHHRFGSDSALGISIAREKNTAAAMSAHGRGDARDRAGYMAITRKNAAMTHPNMRSDEGCGTE